jgi:uncharacterized protein (DUF697 family)
MAEKSKTDKKVDEEAPNAEQAGPEAEAVEKIIRKHVGYSMVAGALPVPLIDIVAVTAIQMDMLKQLATVYRVDFSEERGKSIVSSIMGATFGTVAGRFGASLVKAVPGIGMLLGIGSQVVFAGASTYALGKVFQSHFEENGTFFNLNMDSMKEKFRGFMDKGSRVARDMRRKRSEEDVFATIEKLKDLKDKGAVTEDEFEKTKKDLLEKLTE